MRENAIKIASALITFIYAMAQYLTVTFIFTSVPFLLIINFIKVSDYNGLLIVLSLLICVVFFSYPLFLLADASSSKIVDMHDRLRYKLIRRVVRYAYKKEIEENNIEISKAVSIIEFLRTLERLNVIPRIRYFEKDGASALFYKAQNYKHYVENINSNRKNIEIAQKITDWLKKW